MALGEAFQCDNIETSAFDVFDQHTTYLLQAHNVPSKVSYCVANVFPPLVIVIHTWCQGCIESHKLNGPSIVTLNAAH